MTTLTVGVYAFPVVNDDGPAAQLCAWGGQPLSTVFTYCGFRSSGMENVTALQLVLAPSFTSPVIPSNGDIVAFLSGGVPAGVSGVSQTGNSFIVRQQFGKFRTNSDNPADSFVVSLGAPVDPSQDANSLLANFSAGLEHGLRDLMPVFGAIFAIAVICALFRRS